MGLLPEVSEPLSPPDKVLTYASTSRQLIRLSVAPGHNCNRQDLGRVRVQDKEIVETAINDAQLNSSLAPWCDRGKSTRFIVYQLDTGKLKEYDVTGKDRRKKPISSLNTSYFSLQVPQWIFPCCGRASDRARLITVNRVHSRCGGQERHQPSGRLPRHRG